MTVTANLLSSHLQLSERMKVVDVISSKVFGDAQQIIAQVTVVLLTIRTKNNNNIRSLHLVSHRVFVLQGDSADCFYIVESGQVRIAMKRSRVCFNVFALETLTIKSSSLAGVRHS